MITVAAVLCFASFAWVLVRIWRSSAPLALATLVLWPVVLLALVIHWGDRDRDIRIPTAAFGLALAGAFWALEAQRYAA